MRRLPVRQLGQTPQAGQDIITRPPGGQIKQAA